MSRPGKYYQPGQERAQRVEALFSRIAPRYDLINDLQSAGLHRWWKRRLVRLAEVPVGGKALDLCCGTGDVVRALARAYPAAELIAGLDFAMPMLKIAQARSPEGRSTARPASGRQAVVRGSASGPIKGLYLRADALSIPVRDAAFDRVTISYGLRNVADIDACLREVRRVLRPGGRLLALDFGKPSHPVIATLYFAYLRAAVPLFGRWFFGDPDTHGYIYDSLMRFPSQQEIAERLLANGFARARVESPLFGIMGILVGEVA